MERMTVLIVDDEPPARQKVRRFLETAPDTTIAGEASDGTEAVARIRALAPDVVVLDVQMPGLDGFGVLAALEDDDLPVVIFATAYDEFAIRAFDVAAVDYLLKPFDGERFRRALDRAREKVAARSTEGDAALRALLARVRAADRALERIHVRSGERSYFVPVADIDRIEAAQNYLIMHAGGVSHTVRGTLAGMSGQLDPGRFARIHRAHIVNVDRIRELRPWSHGDYTVILLDGTELPLSRRYREKLPQLFAQRF